MEGTEETGAEEMQTAEEAGITGEQTGITEEETAESKTREDRGDAGKISEKDSGEEENLLWE